MTNTREEHVEERILACLEGRLPEAEANAVRNHCRRCRICGQAWARWGAVFAALEDDRATATAPPLWPAVRHRLERRDPARFGLPFSLGLSAAAAAGIALGLLGGSRGADRSPADPWAGIGSTFSDAAGLHLADTYLAAMTGPEGESP